ncbi:MAG: hypothetical protein ABIP87_00015, partial [Thermomonas sp.]
SGLTLLWRMQRGDRWWQPHVEHVFQRLSRRKGHCWVTLAYGLWTTIAIGVMLSFWGSSGNKAFVAFLACSTAAALAWWWVRRHYAKHTEGLGS